MQKSATIKESVEKQDACAPQRRIRLYLVRHGEPTKTGDGADPGLTERGMRQASLLADRLRPLDFQAIYLSPLRRAMETAHPLIADHNSVTVRVTADIIEVLHDHMLVPINRASADIRMTLEQERDALHRFINRLRHTHEAGDNVLIVAHGNLIRTLIPLTGGRDPSASVLIELDHASLSILDFWSGHGRAALMLANCTRHLPEGDITR